MLVLSVSPAQRQDDIRTWASARPTIQPPVEDEEGTRSAQECAEEVRSDKTMMQWRWLRRPLEFAEGSSTNCGCYDHGRAAETELLGVVSTFLVFSSR